MIAAIIILGMLLFLSIFINYVCIRVIIRAAKVFENINAELQEMDFFEGNEKDPDPEEIELEFLNSTIILNVEDKSASLGAVKSVDTTKWEESKIIGLTYFVPGIKDSQVFVLPQCNVWLLKNGKWLWRQMDDF